MGNYEKIRGKLEKIRGKLRRIRGKILENPVQIWENQGQIWENQGKKSGKIREKVEQIREKIRENQGKSFWYLAGNPEQCKFVFDVWIGKSVAVMINQSNQRVHFSKGTYYLKYKYIRGKSPLPHTHTCMIRMVIPCLQLICIRWQFHKSCVQFLLMCLYFVRYVDNF